MECSLIDLDRWLGNPVALVHPSIPHIHLVSEETVTCCETFWAYFRFWYCDQFLNVLKMRYGK